MLNSLRSRLLFYSGLLLSALMLLLGWAVVKLYYSSQLNELREQMRLHSHSILAVAEYQEPNHQHSDGRVVFPAAMAEPLLNSPDSGFYAQLVDQNNRVIWASRSAQRYPVLGQQTAPLGEWRYSTATRTKQDVSESQINETLFVARFGIQWQPNVVTNLVLMRDMGPLLLRVEGLKHRLWVILSLLSAMLIGIQLLVLKWGMQPLKQLAVDLHALQQGKQAHLLGRYPAELKPLIANLNHVLETERNQRERYRNTLSDLSHSLKTPLTVANGVVEKLQPKQPIAVQEKTELTQQLSRMSQIIQYQLQRSMLGGQSLAFSAVPVRPVIEAVSDALRKVYADKPVDIRHVFVDACEFIGDENDLMEITGNLMDNACKYGAGQVRVTTQHCKPKTNTTLEDGRWQLIVEDNGQGIQAEQLHTVLQRGVRLDTLGEQANVHGQGLGLALVKDIVVALGAQISVTRSDLGGCRFAVTFPNTALVKADA